MLWSRIFEVMGRVPEVGNAWRSVEKFLSADYQEKVKAEDPDFYGFLEELFPLDLYGAAIKFHGVRNIANANLELYPARDLLEYGFLSFASDLDGSDFLCYIENKRIYQVGHCGKTAEETMAQAVEEWDGILVFLDWLPENI